MLCEVCQKRPATVHITHCFTDHQSRQDLCEVCAGTKTEAELEQSIAAREEQRRLERTRAHELIHKEFFEPVAALWESKGMQTRPNCFYGKLVLIPISSSQAEVDPIEFIFGVSEKGKNHVQRQLEDFQVHVVRWDPNPQTLVTHLFEPFHEPGVSLDLEEKLLMVRRDSTLFPDIQTSYAFCNVAAWSLGSFEHPNRIDYQFRAQSKCGKQMTPPKTAT